MMKRLGSISATVAFVTGVLSVGAALAQAPLGFTIDPTSGIRGSTVNGQVSTADVAANCVTDLTAFQDRFTQLFQGPFVSGDTVGDLPQTWFPDPNNIVYENTNQMAYLFTLATVLGISADLNGAAGTALPQTFVMTFADVVTQKPLGTLGHFDPATGVGSVVVPDLIPGSYPVAAVCVGPSFDLDKLRAGIEASGAYFTSLGMQFGADGPNSPEFEAWAQGFLNTTSTGFDLIIEFATAVGPTLIQNIAQFDALGVQFFNIVNPTLGFTIDPTSGPRGTVVNGQVNPADVAQYCVTDVPGLQAEFQAVIAGPYEGGGPQGELFNRFFPTPDFIFTTTDQAAYSLTGITALGIGANIFNSADTALPQTFVMTFADPLTQEPLGTLGHFDPTTGVGSVVTPDLTPGPWPVAAACVRPFLDVDQLEAGIRKNGAFLTSIGAPADINSPEFSQFVIDYLGDPNADIFQFLNAIGPTLVQNIVSPAALGVQFFTITTPTLGFTIDPTSGLPGETVNGQVNPADVAQYCVTELEPFQTEFQDLIAGPYAGGGTGGDLFPRFFPGGDFVFENHDQAAYSITGIIALGIGANINGAAETALPQTFVMTFADFAQNPLGELGHFDPVTGVGSVTVPNIDPGLYPVAAACVRPLMDLDPLEAGIRKNGAYLESIGMPADINSPEFQTFVENFPGANGDLFAFLNIIGPTIIQNIVSPAALGVQFFTILADVDHFQCYRARTTGFSKVPITLSDRFGNRSATVRSAIDLCAPANKNGEDPEAPGSPGYLTSYKISPSGSFQQVSGVVAENQFGSVTLNVKKPKVLLVPTAVSSSGPPSSADGAFVNHFNCYDVRIANGTPAPLPGSVTIQTAFETVQVQPQKPKRLCVPTSKNGEPVIASRPENLLCYKAKSGKGLNPAPTVFLKNQFGQQTQRLGQRRELCIPTDLAP